MSKKSYWRQVLVYVSHCRSCLEDTKYYLMINGREDIEWCSIGCGGDSCPTSYLKDKPVTYEEAIEQIGKREGWLKKQISEYYEELNKLAEARRFLTESPKGA